jgi:hypothetical protein
MALVVHLLLVAVYGTRPKMSWSASADGVVLNPDEDEGVIFF